MATSKPQRYVINKLPVAVMISYSGYDFIQWLTTGIPPTPIASGAFCFDCAAHGHLQTH